MKRLTYERFFAVSVYVVNFVINALLKHSTSFL